MNNNEAMLSAVEAYLGYTETDIKTFRENTRNMEILQRLPSLMNTRFVLEIVEAHGCACRHVAGQKLYIGGDAALIAQDCPEKVCVYLLQAIAPILYAAQEFIYEGIDPNRLRFKRVACLDVGLECGGLGRVVVEFSAA